MKRWMTLLILTVGLGLGLGFSSGGTAEAKGKWKKALGMKSCNLCHEKGKPKKEPSEGKLYKKALKHSKKAKTCMECHDGKRKPEKK